MREVKCEVSKWVLNGERQVVEDTTLLSNTVVASLYLLLGLLFSPLLQLPLEY